MCRRLDGLPLALELAAARVKLMPPGALLQRLDAVAGMGALGLLTSGPRDLPARQQTLRATIDWSYRLLDARERHLFARLAVFVGSASFEAVEGVCSDNSVPAPDVLDALASLVDKSLVRSLEVAGGEQRFVQLETIREYARERLQEQGELDTWRARHASYFLALAQQAVPELQGAEESRWWSLLEAEHDNIRAALAWFEQCQDTMSMLQLATAIWYFWLVRGHLNEGRRWLEAGLRTVSVPTLRLRATSALGLLLWQQGDYDRATALSEETLDVARELSNPQETARALNTLGMIATSRRDLDMARLHYAEALTLCRQLGHTQAISTMLNNLGLVAMYQDDLDEAEALLNESRELDRGLGTSEGEAGSLTNLGMLARFRGDVDRAEALLQEGLALFRQLHHGQGSADALTELAWLALTRGDYHLAVQYSREAITLFQQNGEREGVMHALEALASAVAPSDAAVAARLWGTAEFLRASIGAARTPMDQARYEADVAAARAELDPAAWDAASEAGRSCPLPDVVALALDGDSPR